MWLDSWVLAGTLEVARCDTTHMILAFCRQAAILNATTGEISRPKNSRGMRGNECWVGCGCGAKRRTPGVACDGEWWTGHPNTDKRIYGFLMAKVGWWIEYLYSLAQF